MGRVQDKVVIVTGAAKGLGEADARVLAAERARVVKTDVDDGRGRAVAKEIGAEYAHQDVVDEAAWTRLMAHVLDHYGRLDVLVNNAGIAIIANIETTTTEQRRRHQAGGCRRSGGAAAAAGPRRAARCGQYGAVPGVR